MGFYRKYLLVFGFILLINQDVIEIGEIKKVACRSKNNKVGVEKNLILDSGKKFLTELQALSHTKFFLD